MMKKGLPIVVVAMAVLFIAAGAGVLLLQDSYLYYYVPDTPWHNYYPLGAVVQLLFAGIPCLVFGALDLIRGESCGKALWLSATVYSCVVLIVYDVLGTICSRIQLMAAVRKGASYVAGLSAVTSAFAQTRIFANAALVFLLILSVLRAAERISDKNA
ncbi:MAG: hypothetical protein NC399_06150 [Muribaculum sp.]|nr:hypothetical protein [Muribaculum sp.]